MTCEHEVFVCVASINRLSQREGGPITHYSADIQIKCQQCGRPFEFVGLPVGSSPYRPTVSLGGTDLRVPITPEGVPPPEGLPSISLKIGETRQ